MPDRKEINKRGYLKEDFRLFHLKDSRAQKLDYHYHEFDKLILLLGGGGDSAETSAPTASSNDGRVKFLTDLGWDVTTSPTDSSQVRIPAASSDVFERYNALQKSQGYDLSEYAGKFKQAGYSVSEYFQLLDNGLGGGAYQLDKVNDAINEVTNRLAVYSPILMDALPLTLEEIFIYELGGEDYAVRDIIL